MEKNIDHAFDEYLKASGSAILKAIPAYLDKMAAAGPRYGRFPIPTFYKPHWIDSGQEHVLKRVAAAMTSVVNTVVQLYFQEKHIESLFRLPLEMKELIAVDPGYSRAVVFSRYDGILEGRSFKLLGCNSDVSGGSAYADFFEEALLAEPALADFFQDNPAKTTSRVRMILDVLLEVYEEFGGLETPRIGIVDWRNARTFHEFELLKTFFESRGYKTTIADPRELKYKGGKLYHRDFRIDLILRRCSFEEVLARLDEVQDFIRAYRDRAVCVVNPFRSWLASTQTLLSILSNPAYDHFFSENENKMKRDCIPWTRRVSEAEDFYGGQKMYLINLLKDEKENLVLKRRGDHAGRGILIGRETRDSDWNEAIDRALKEDWMMQSFVNVPVMTVPQITNHKLDFDYKRYNFNALIFGGRYSGGFVKVSSETVVNAAKSGGVIPSISTDTMPVRWDLADSSSDQQERL